MCPFCAIASGDGDAHLVLEEPGAVAFLDHRPLFPGHCLLIPREHRATLADLAPGEVGSLFESARLLAHALELGVDAEGAFLAINNKVSQSVAHVHVHVVPRRRKDGLRGFFWPRTRYDDDQHMASVATSLRAAVQATRGEFK